MITFMIVFGLPLIVLLGALFFAEKYSRKEKEDNERSI